MQNAKNYISKAWSNIDPFLCIKRLFAFVMFIELWLEIKTHHLSECRLKATFMIDFVSIQQSLVYKNNIGGIYMYMCDHWRLFSTIEMQIWETCEPFLKIYRPIKTIFIWIW